MTPISNPIPQTFNAGQCNYVGNSSGAERAIAHGLTFTPKKVVIWAYEAVLQDVNWFVDETGHVQATNIAIAAPYVAWRTVTAPDATNVYVGSAANYMNETGKHYCAILIA